MRNFFNIILLTVSDQVRQKSFIALLVVGVLLVLMVRTCSSGNFSMNGQQYDSVTIAWHASKIAFQVVVAGMYLLCSLLAMRLFGRDLDDGSTTLFLSRPVVRWHYVLGRVTGTWLLSALFMFALHCTLFFLMWAKTGGYIPGYLFASLVCSINLLFVISLVCLLSLFLPDIIAALAGVAVIIVGFVSDGGYQIMNSAMFKPAVPQEMAGDPALWRIVYPKLFMVQSWAESLITKNEFAGLGPVHPLVNVIVFTAIIITVLAVSFNRREV